jgi:UDP-N-acetylmuramyl pentapeptide synthase
MLELGDNADEEHRRVISLVNDLSFSEVLYVGPLFTRVLDDDKYVFPNVEHAAEWLKKFEPEGYAILIKGSRKIELEKLIDVL